MMVNILGLNSVVPEKQQLYQRTAHYIAGFRVIFSLFETSGFLTRAHPTHSASPLPKRPCGDEWFTAKLNQSESRTSELATSSLEDKLLTQTDFHKTDLWRLGADLLARLSTSDTHSNFDFCVTTALGSRRKCF